MKEKIKDLLEQNALIRAEIKDGNLEIRLKGNKSALIILVTEILMEMHKNETFEEFKKTIKFIEFAGEQLFKLREIENKMEKAKDNNADEMLNYISELTDFIENLIKKIDEK